MDNAGFSAVSEITGYKVTAEQIQRMYTRYRFAGQFVDGKDVLEAACGSGQGLGYLAEKAKKVIGVDIDEKILAKAKEHYRESKNIRLELMDVQKLPFTDSSFDVIILYEAIYYLPEPAEFIKKAYRLLRRNGQLLICTANKELPDFNPSPHSHKYFSASELFELIKKHGYEKVELFGDCRIKTGSPKAMLTSMIKKIAVKFNLIPKTMKGKELFKKIFYGELVPLPAEIRDNLAQYIPPEPIAQDSPNRRHKVIFAVGYK
ncbi:MAG: class I SAM-dependent methyltransferase [Candidatus Omnitrophica bacterium]|nr:class I SAM-dependent methyltransferase [Candidatus Omnitrophota bacterium]MDD5655305.1 class I SAM-dependent methyltransferase [Candidatus Omnitrophota bacterium]